MKPLHILILPAVLLPSGALAEPTIPSPAAPLTEGKAATIDPRDDMRRVCAVYPVTGSLIERKTCKTRAAWIALGVDPLARR